MGLFTGHAKGMAQTISWNSAERQATWTLSAVMCCRMLGLFMLLPVLTLFVADIPGATEFWIGASIGAYGLTQALLQLPLSRLSDGVGRRPIIQVGLLLFILGSLLAAFVNHIVALVLARALQGAGAIGATVLAQLADATREEVRTRSMATIGISIGGAFVLALLLGPVLAAVGGLSLIFGVTATLGVLALWFVSRLPIAAATASAGPVRWRDALTPGLVVCAGSIALLHAWLSMLFLWLPPQVAPIFGTGMAVVWQLYLPVFLVALLGLRPLLKRGHALAGANHVLTLGFVSLTVWTLLLMNTSQPLVIWWALVGFFVSFTALEALIPSYVSRVIPATVRGTAMGIYSTCQFVGIFIGGVLGGLLWQTFGTVGLESGLLVLGGVGVMLARHRLST